MRNAPRRKPGLRRWAEPLPGDVLRLTGVGAESASRRESAGPTMPIEVRRARPADLPVLFDVWLRSVRATHTFLTEVDIAFLERKVRDYLASADSELFVIDVEAGAVAGFMGLGGNEVEALFLAPEHVRRGFGTRFIAEARSLRPGADLTVDVNEQNEGARRFYEACGFSVDGRSEVDGEGLPFPILHMRSTGSGSGSVAPPTTSSVLRRRAPPI